MKIIPIILLVTIYSVHVTFAAPIDEDSDPEDRRFLRNKRKRPCRRDATGRTFFDWHYNININNYFSDCGGYGQFPIYKPIGGHHQHNNNHQGGGIFGGPFGGGFFGGNNPNKGGGLFGLGLFDWLGGSSSRPSNNRPKPGSTEAPQVTESENGDDYQEDKPVNEDIDEVVLDRNPNAPYGNYDVTNFNPAKVVKRVNKGFDNFFRPFYDLFRK